MYLVNNVLENQIWDVPLLRWRLWQCDVSVTVRFPSSSLGWRVRVPGGGVGPHLRRGQGPDLEAAGAGRQEEDQRGRGDPAPLAGHQQQRGGRGAADPRTPQTVSIALLNDCSYCFTLLVQVGGEERVHVRGGGGGSAAGPAAALRPGRGLGRGGRGPGPRGQPQSSVRICAHDQVD